MPDYADWTESIELLGSEVMVPFDVQGAFIQVPMDLQGALIQMPVDIQGQYIDLKVDIVAQTVGSIAIDISAQTIGNLAISVSAQSVGVYLQPEWAASQQTDKNFRASQADLSYGCYGLATYTVPTGKTLYITHIGGYSYAYTTSYADQNHMMAISIYDETAPGYLFETGGNGGAFANFSKPLRVPAGHTIWFMAWVWANHNCNVSVSASGYEV
jgi:hypothetical protein